MLNELMKQITEAEEQALLKKIETNAIILNEDFDFVKDFALAFGSSSGEARIKAFSPMICGKHIFIGKLPEKYSFALTKVDPKLYETELDFYKRRCKELEEQLTSIKEILEQWNTL